MKYNDLDFVDGVQLFPPTLFRVIIMRLSLYNHAKFCIQLNCFFPFHNTATQLEFFFTESHFLLGGPYILSRNSIVLHFAKTIYFFVFFDTLWA